MKPTPAVVDGYRVPQYSAADLAALDPQEITDARHAGALDHMLGAAPRRVADRLRDGDQLTRADLAGMTAAEINTARAEGRLDDLLGIQQTNNRRPA